MRPRRMRAVHASRVCQCMVDGVGPGGVSISTTPTCPSESAAVMSMVITLPPASTRRITALAPAIGGVAEGADQERDVIMLRRVAHLEGHRHLRIKRFIKIAADFEHDAMGARLAGFRQARAAVVVGAGGVPEHV